MNAAPDKRACRNCSCEFKKSESKSLYYCSAECQKAYYKIISKVTVKDRQRYYLTRKAKLEKLEKPRQCRVCFCEVKRNADSRRYPMHCSDRCKKLFVKDVIQFRTGAKRRARKYAVYETGIQWMDIFNKSQGCCVDCGLQLKKKDRGLNVSYSPEIDHILPLASGGAHISDNMQLLCKGCNGHKGGKISVDEIEKLEHLKAANVDVYKLALENLHRPFITNTTGYKGVTYIESKEMYRASFFNKEGVRFYLGFFGCRHKAGEAAKEAREKEYFS